MKRQTGIIRRVFLTLLVALATASLPVRAQYAGGSGTADDPYRIATAAQLNAIGLREADWDKHFRLTADIDMNDSGRDPGEPDLLLPRRLRRQRSYDRESDLPSEGRRWPARVALRAPIGLFRVISGWDALVKDLGLIDPNVRPDPTCTKRVSGVGALAGSLSEGWIRNCYVKGGYVGARSMRGRLGRPVLQRRGGLGVLVHSRGVQRRRLRRGARRLHRRRQASGRATQEAAFRGGLTSAGWSGAPRGRA